MPSSAAAEPPSAATQARDNKRAAQLWLAYVGRRLYEQFTAVGLISSYLVAFHWLVLGKPPNATILLALIAVVVGISLFMEGFLIGIMPLGELLGKGLPTQFSLHGSLFTCFCLGFACTLAEPAMGALELAGGMVSVKEAPYLWLLLNEWNFVLVASIGLGVGVAALVGVLRLLKKWSIKPVILASCSTVLFFTLLSVWAGLPELVGLAWDTGAVTTGAVTVPIVLGLGLGIISTTRKEGEAENALDGFGIVTLASLYPVVFVIVIGMCCAFIMSPEEIDHMAQNFNRQLAKDPAGWLFVSPMKEVTYTTRAIVPLVGMLVGLIRWGLGEQLPQIAINLLDDGKTGTEAAAAEQRAAEGRERAASETGVGNGEEYDDEYETKVSPLVGVLIAYVGLCVFNMGLNYGLAVLDLAAV